MSAHDPLPELVALAKRQATAESSRRDNASFQAFEARLTRRRSGVYRTRFAIALSAAMLLVAGVWFGRSRSEQAPLQYEIVREAANHDDGLERGASRLSFSDGSSVALGHETQAHVQGASPRGASVVLTRGSVGAKIVPRPGGDWWFEAGPYKVHVTGTAFALAWDPEQRVIRLTMHSGSVEVRGPMAEQGLVLRRGQRLVGALNESRLEVELASAAEREPRAAIAPASPVEPEAAAANNPDDVAPGPTLNRERKRRRAGQGLPSLVAEGEFAQVLARAHTRGVDRLLRSAAASELAALADAARYEGDEALAQRALLALRARFPASSSAEAAAYFLARVSHGKRAERWYETYLRERPNGPFAAPALGALMTLQAQRGALMASEASARAYLRREPAGPYAPAARKIIADVDPDA